jgi:heme/copper-type cytochrome/quinol oxidase subunit 2
VGELGNGGSVLFWVVVLLAIGVFVAIEALLVRSAWRSRVPHSEGDATNATHGTSRAAEVIWTLVPAVLLALLIVWSLRSHG